MFLRIEGLEKELWVICFESAMTIFDILIGFKMAAFIDLEAVTSSTFEILNQKSYRFLLVVIL